MAMKKGMVFSLDAALGITFIILILAVVSFNINDAENEGKDLLSARRIGADIVAVLDYNNTLDSLNEAKITQALNEILPQNMNMSMTIYVQNSPYTIECPTSLVNLTYGCYDYTATSGCWSGSKAGFVTYPPAENCYNGSGTNYKCIKITDLY